MAHMWGTTSKMVVTSSQRVTYYITYNIGGWSTLFKPITPSGVKIGIGLINLDISALFIASH